jgi:hypothetical protein
MPFDFPRQILSNDSTISGGGVEFDDEIFTFNFANETSALTGSATLVPIVNAKAPGVIADVWIGTVAQAVSASGFVSGTVDAQVNINSAAVLSTLPAINMVGSAGQVVRKTTLTGGGVSAVVNLASASFSAGDAISLNWNARSVGSAAAGAAGAGLYVSVRLRYKAR